MWRDQSRVLRRIGCARGGSNGGEVGPQRQSRIRSRRHSIRDRSAQSANNSRSRAQAGFKSRRLRDTSLRDARCGIVQCNAGSARERLRHTSPQCDLNSSMGQIHDCATASASVPRCPRSDRRITATVIPSSITPTSTLPFLPFHSPPSTAGEIPEINQRRADQGREDAQGRQKQHGGCVESARRLSFFCIRHRGKLSARLAKATTIRPFLALHKI